MKTGAFSIGLFLVLLFGGCQELEEPILESNEPKFFLTGMLNGSPMNMEAGNDSLFMHTGFNLDSVEVHEFSGCLGNLACLPGTPCPNSVSIFLRDSERGTKGTSHIYTTLVPGELPFKAPADSVTTGYRVSFTDESHVNTGTLSYFWDFGDGNTSMLPTPVHVYSQNSAPGVTACLTVTNTVSGYTSTRCNYIPLPENCKADYSYSFSGSNLTALNASESGVAPYTFLWDFGSGFLPLSGQTLPDFSQIDSQRVCLKVIDALNCEAVMCRTMLVQPGNVDAAANFSWNVSRERTLDLLALGQVTLVYTDETGKEWRSDAFEQSGGAFFKVIEVETYQPNHLGEATMAFTLETNCKLFGNSPSDYYTLQEASGSLAVAHP